MEQNRIKERLLKMYRLATDGVDGEKEWESYYNFCAYYKLFLNGQGVEPTCRCPEFLKKQK